MNKKKEHHLAEVLVIKLKLFVAVSVLTDSEIKHLRTH